MDPEKKIVKFPVWDLETDEIIEMEMDEESYNAMCKAEEEIEKEREARRRAIEEEEWETWRICRSDSDDYY